MSAYRVEVQKISGAWVLARVAQSKSHKCAIGQVLRDKSIRDYTAIRAVREYGDGNLSEGIRRSARMIEKGKQPFS